VSAGTAWIAAFPLVEAERAVQALVRSWDQMASQQRAFFHPRIHEPKLTRVVRSHVRRHTAIEMRLPGHWGAEGVENEIDFETGEVLDEARTDITYLWNNADSRFVLVFEFKKVAALADSRKQYIDRGMMRFVTGIYAEKEPMAVMVGILMAPETEVVGGLRRAISVPAAAAALRACQDGNGRFVLEPLLLPSHAAFDTEHLRQQDKAPQHGTIRIAHLFVGFPWMTYAPKRSRRAERMAAAEGTAEADE
jgi:hypothetical protein